MKFLTILLVFCIVFSCSHEKPTGKTEAEVLYKEAKQLSEDGHYLLATEKLNKIKSEHPYSFYATPAELLQADVYFLQESYVESAAVYLLFRDMHPKHERLDYVIYKIAESYYMQMPETFDRDLAAGHQAIKYFKELQEKYPKSEYIIDAQKKISYCEEMIIKKEKYIADFYYKTKVFDAARFRYLDIIKQFNAPALRNHAMVRAVESSFFMSDFIGCVKFADEFESYLSGKDKDSIVKTRAECKNKLTTSKQEVPS